MSIRFASSKDLLQIKELWDISFPGEPVFDHWFFRHVYKEENTILYCHNGKVYSMLQIIPYMIDIQGIQYPVHYIYGVCTHPDYRKRGLMAQLLNYAWKIGKNRGDIASILIPQDEWLFGIYEKFGYQASFFIDKYELIIRNPSQVILKTLVEASEKDIEQMGSLYITQTKNLSGAIVRSREYWEQQIELFKAIEGHVYCLKQDEQCRAYGFVGFIDEQLCIQEGFAKDPRTLLSFAEQVAIKENKQSVTILAPCQQKVGGGVPLGCMKWLDNQYEKKFSGYMNLMYN
jgi:predicted acetyltransferase